MVDASLVDASRLQFAVTAYVHFMFVPLTLGLSMLMCVMETVYLMTGRVVYKDMTRFWGKLFGINFAMGVATGLPLEFQFGTNWAYFSHFVGDVFGVPVAIEGLMAFFLESTFVGLFFFGWDRLSKVGHLCVTYLTAMGASLSAVWILIANGWMQNPVGAAFNPLTQRMELQSLWDVVFNPVAQAKFVHTISAGYVTGAVFVLAVSSWYLLRGRDTGFALRSFRIAAAFGLAATLSVIVLGDESGYTSADTQAVKMAAIEAMWETEPPPAGLTLFGWPDEHARVTHAEVRIPYVLGLLGTRSTDRELIGLDRLEAIIHHRIERGIIAVQAWRALQNKPDDRLNQVLFEEFRNDLGYGLLLTRYTDDVSQATEAMKRQALDDAVPRVAPLFWSFRIMVGLAFVMLALMVTAFWSAAHNRVTERRWLLRWALWSLPFPWIAIVMGWFVSEYGRQPWVVQDILPTFMAVSALNAQDVVWSLTGFSILYVLLLIVGTTLTLKVARMGPSSLGTGRYALEHPSSSKA